MKALLTCLIALTLMARAVIQTGLPDIGNLLRQGNSSGIGKLFSSGIELTLPADDNLYNKGQAETALAGFFKDHRPKNVNALHKINSSSNFLFEVFILSTEKGNFRVACTLKNTLGDFTILELRIEPARGS